MNAVEKGKKIVLVVCLLQLLMIGLNLIINGMDVKDLIRTGLSIVMYYYMYKGYNWVKNLYCVLSALGIVMTILILLPYMSYIGNNFFMENIRFLVIFLIVYMIISIVCLSVILFSKSVKAFYMENTSGKLVTRDVTEM